MKRTAMRGLCLAFFCSVATALWSATFTKEVSADTTYSALFPDASPAAEDEVTVNLVEGVTLTLDGTVTLASLTVNGNGQLAKAADATIAITHLAVNGTPTTGTLPPFWAVPAKASSGKNVTDFSFLNRLDTAGVYTVSGALAFHQRRWTLTGGSVSCTTFRMNDLTSGTSGTADSDKWGPTVLELEGGARFTVTSTADGKSAAVVLAQSGNYSARSTSPKVELHLRGSGTVFEVPDGTLNLANDGQAIVTVSGGARLSAYKVLCYEGITSSNGGGVSTITVSDGGVLAIGSSTKSDGLLTLPDNSYDSNLLLNEGAVLEANGDWSVATTGTGNFVFIRGATTLRPNDHTVTLARLGTGTGALSIEGTGTVKLTDYVGGYTGAVTVGMGTVLDLSAVGSGATNAVIVNGTVRLGENGTLPAAGMPFTLGEDGKVAFQISPGTLSVTLPAAVATAVGTELAKLQVMDAEGIELDLSGATLADGVLTLPTSLTPVTFDVPDSWNYTPASIPQVSDSFMVASTFSLYGQSSAAQTVNGREALVGKLSGADALSGVSVYGGLSDNTVATTIAKDVWMKVLSGNYDRLCGGSNKWGHSGKKAVTTTGNLLIEMTGGTTKDIIGGDYGDGQAPSDGYVLEGNIAITVSGTAKVAGTIVGGSIGQHNGKSTVRGNTSLTVKNVQDGSSGTAFSKVPAGYLVAGPVWGGNQSTQSTVTGNSELIVALPENAQGSFVKHLVGGAMSLGNNGTYSVTAAAAQTVQGNASVSVTAPTAVTFSGNIVGGGIATNEHSNQGTASVTGNVTVTLDGGVYTGTVTAGGSGTYGSVGGSATLMLKGGDFTAATLQPGNVTGTSTLAVRCAATVKNLTAFDVIDLSAAGSSLSVTTTFTLPESGMIQVVVPSDAALESVIPLIVTGMDEAMAARFVFVRGDFRYQPMPVEGGLKMTLPTVTFARPATEAWNETVLEMSPVVRSVNGKAWLADGVVYETSAGGTQVSAVHVPVAVSGASIYGGFKQDAGGTIAKSVRIQVTDGDWEGIFGGSECTNWNSGKAKESTYSRDLLVDMAGGSADYVFGGARNDGAKQTYKGNLAVVISGDAVVWGSVSGGGSSQHSFENLYGTASAPVELSVTVRNLQSENTASGLSGSTAVKAGYIGGGPFYASNTASKFTINGDTTVVIELPDEATGTFSKALVGGILALKSDKTLGSSAIHTVTGQTSVSVKAPASVTFDKDVTGGHWTVSDYPSVPVKTGSSAVTLNGGVYSGTVTAGSLGGKNNGLGPATLTVGASGATFKGRVQGGTANGKTLALDGTLTLDGGTLDLASFTAVSGTAPVAITSGTLSVGTLRAATDFGTVTVSEAAAGSIAVTQTEATELSVKLPLTGEPSVLTKDAFLVKNGSVTLTVTSVTVAADGVTLDLGTFSPPLKAVEVAGGTAEMPTDWASLTWQGNDGAAAPAESVAAWTGERALNLSGDAFVRLGSAVTATPFAVNGTGTLTLSAAADGSLTANTVAVNTDVVTEAGAARLTGVTVAEGKTLTVKDTATVDINTQNAVQGQTGTLRLEGVTAERTVAYTSATEAKIEVGKDSVLTLGASDSGGTPLGNSITVTGSGVLVLAAKDTVGWNPSAEEIGKTRLIARDTAILRKPEGVVESMRCTYEMGGTSQLEVGKVTLSGTAYGSGFAMCRGARIKATDGTPRIAGLAGATGTPTIALRCTASGATIAASRPYAEFEVAVATTLTVDVALQRFANGAHSNFPVRKTGAGELVLAKANQTDGMNELQVLAGTLRLKETGTWDSPVALAGTLAGETGASVASLTLNTGAKIDASSGMVKVNGTVTLAAGVTEVPVTLATDAKAGDVILACTAPDAAIAAVLKAADFTVTAVQGVGYALFTSSMPNPSDTGTMTYGDEALTQLRFAAAQAGITADFTVKALNGGAEGSSAEANGALTCFDGLTVMGDEATSTVTVSYAFGITGVTASSDGTTAAVTVAVQNANGADAIIRTGTRVELFPVTAPDTALATQTLSADAGTVTFTDIPIAGLGQGFKVRAMKE